MFFAVGFETTAPANALSVIHANKLNVLNYSILASQVLVPPAIEAIMQDAQTRVNAFLAAGHVCTIMGLEEYFPLVEKYQIPIVVTGFEPLDLLQGIVMAVEQLEKGIAQVENQYTRYVQREGNLLAQETVNQVFSPTDREWRGIGTIPLSGLEVKANYAQYNARLKFTLNIPKPPANECRAGEILKGLLKPQQCPFFGKACKPEHPMGAPMVSSEGACAAYYHYAENLEPEMYEY